MTLSTRCQCRNRVTSKERASLCFFLYCRTLASERLLFILILGSVQAVRKTVLPLVSKEGVYEISPVSLVLCPVSGMFRLNVEVVSISDGMIQCLYH